MSTLIERIARAIDPSQWDNFDGYCSLKGFNDAERAEEMAASPSLQSSLDRAIAALKAMREPTEAMLTAGDIPGWDDSVTIGHSDEVWRAMITAAIQEHSNPTRQSS